MLNTRIKYLCFFLLAGFGKTVYAQTEDTIRLYEYTNYKSQNWKLKIFDSSHFKFLAGNYKIQYFLLLEGKYSVTDTTVQFICDTTDNTNPSVIERDSLFSPTIKAIARGEFISRAGKYFVPASSNKYAARLPKAKYVSGHDLGSTIIEFTTNKRYIIHTNSCKTHWVEKGYWTMKDNLITVHPFKKQPNIHRFFTSNDQFFVLNEYLVARSFEVTNEDSKQLIAEKFLLFN